MSSIPKPDGPDINIGGPMMVRIWVLTSISLVIVGTRLYAQWRTHRRLDLGDGLMSLSMICGCLLCSMLTAQHHYGLGRHFFYLTDHQRIQSLKYNFLGQAFGIMGPAFGRMATCLLMLKLFGTKKALRRFLWFLFWESLVVNSVTLILVFVQCKDVQSLWDPAGHPSSCWSPLVQENTGFVQGALNSATDLALTILPSSMFWSLKINLRLKIGLAVLLSLSIFAFVACVVKTIQLQSLADRDDFTFNTVPFFTWVIVEITLVNSAASVPLIRPLFVRASAKRNTSYELKYQYGKPTNKGTRLRSADPESDPNRLEANDSEERILPIEGAKVSVVKGDDVRPAKDVNGIMVSESYVITYDEDKDMSVVRGRN